MWRSILWINLIDDESSTNYKLKRKEKKKNVKKYLKLKMQKARSALNVLHKMFCLSQSKQSLFRNFFIISRKFHHFAKVFDAMRNLDDASSRWRELSIASTSVAPLPGVGTNEIFVTIFFEILIQIIFVLDFFYNNFDYYFLDYQCCRRLISCLLIDWNSIFNSILIFQCELFFFVWIIWIIEAFK